MLKIMSDALKKWREKYKMEMDLGAAAYTALENMIITKISVHLTRFEDALKRNLEQFLDNYWKETMTNHERNDLIFGMVCAGNTLEEITEELNKHGEPACTEVEVMQAKEDYYAIYEEK